jgi:dihydrofolate synthase / folylpolyglutamate synthase
MEAQMPDYRTAVAEVRERRVEWEIEPSIERTYELMDLLGSPQRAYPVIHVAGTNGKTSTTRLIDALLRERGLRVGRYTSPELTTLRERIAIDGEPVSEALFARTYADLAPYLEMIDGKHGVRLSFFEVLTAMAFTAFADAPVDVAVIEVGMGGTWDATNVADGAVAVVTPIALDHTDHLGDTIGQIAAEKAGIIKPGAIAVLGRQLPEAVEVLAARVAETGAVAVCEGVDFGVLRREIGVGGQLLRLRGLYGDYDGIYLPLFGEHQAGNAACALAAVEAFASGAPTALGEVKLEDATRGAEIMGTFEGEEGQLDPELVRAAFARSSSPGRLEIARTGPTVLLDSAHNPAGMAASVAALVEEFGFTRLVGVLAVSAGKDVTGLLEALEPVLAELVVSPNSSPRSMSAEELGDLAEGIFGVDRVHMADRLDDAIDQALGLAEETGEYQGAGVLITGSVVTAGDARTLLRVEGRR